MPIAHTTATSPNPGDLVFVAAAPAVVTAGMPLPPAGSGVNPVEYSFIIPAVIETGVDRS